MAHPRAVGAKALGPAVSTISRQLQQCEACARRWIERFTAAGWDELDDVFTREARVALPIPRTPTVAERQSARAVAQAG